MDEPPIEIDVRDMLCAQALAIVSKEIAAVIVGKTAKIFYTTADVRNDICVWAQSLKYNTNDLGAGILEIVKS